MNPTASHVDYKIAQNNLQPYLEDIFDWTQRNDLILNPDKSTATLFTPDPTEYKTILNLTINNTIIPTVKNPKILGLTFDTKLNFGKHAKINKKSGQCQQNCKNSHIHFMGKTKRNTDCNIQSRS